MLASARGSMQASTPTNVRENPLPTLNYNFFLLFDWLNGPVMSAGMISPLDPDLVHITDDLNEAVDVALSGLI